MLKKRGQFTIFVILGIVIFLAFAIAFCARNFLRESVLEGQARDILSQTLSTSPMDFYVTTCIEQVTDEALYYIGMQGGNIYTYQNGSLVFDETRRGQDFLQYNLDGTHQNVSYGILSNTQPECLQPTVPEYPYEDLHVQYFWSRYRGNVLYGDCLDPDWVQGAFGINTLQKLCDSEGFNAFDISNASIFSCRRGSYDTVGQNESTQEQMQYYISKKIKECVDFSVFEEVSNNEIRVLNDPKTTIIFGSEGFRVNVSYPFQVSVDGGEPITIRQDFQIRSHVRLKEMYILAQNIIKQDSRFVFYNKTAEFYMTRNRVFPYIQDMKFNLLEKPCFDICTEGKYDDIFQIIDNASFVRNKPYVFQFAIKNRRPALEYIHYVESDWFDIIGSEGVPLLLDPQGYDPDEDFMTYEYKAWREDYWEKFNPDCCDIGLGTVDCTNLTKLWEERDECFFRMPTPPNSWTRSQEYVDTGRKAGYMPNFNDTGIHHTTIRVEDDFGLEDWQNITILIYDLPNANATGYNDYSDIQDNRTSIEDPYTLNSSGSSVYLSRMMLYMWNDTIENFHNITRQESLLIPFNITEPGSVDITNIRDIYMFSVVGNHIINLRAASDLDFITWGEEDNLTVEVYRCLPHEDPSPPYPYNNLGTDPFQANHTCCVDTGSDYEYAGTGKACFLDILFGIHDRFDRNDYVGPFPAAPSITRVWNPPAAPAYPYDNDVYRNNFTRYCEAERGNICTGEAYEYLTVFDECDDGMAGEDERCQGPPNQDSSINPIRCVNYTPGNSFELNFSEPGATGICEDTPKCSDQETFTYPAKFKCEAQCGNGTCSYPYKESCVCVNAVYCGMAISSECHGGKAGECVSAPDEGFCNADCDFHGPDDSLKGCNCTSGNEICDDAEKDCWVVNSPGPGFCCEEDASDNGCDGLIGFAAGACVDGRYHVDEEQYPEVCECEADEGAWFGFFECCDGDNTNEDYENPGPGNKCCANGVLMVSGAYNTLLLCYDGEFYGCDQGVGGIPGEEIIPEGDSVGGILCTWSGWTT